MSVYGLPILSPDVAFWEPSGGLRRRLSCARSWLPILNRILSGVLTRKDLGNTETVGVSTADRIH